MEDCIFCKIVKKEVPCCKIYEDEKTIAFLDVNPVVIGHTLVVPKKHFTNVLDCEEEYLSAVMNTVKKISNHYLQKLNCQGINVLNASGKAAQQSVFHLHFHILPRYDNDNIDVFPKTKYIKEDLEKLSLLLRM